MKHFLIILLSILLGISCIKKSDTPTSQNNNKTMQTSAMNNSEYKPAKGFIAGMIKNTGLSKDQALKVMEIRKKYNKQITVLPKGPDGKWDQVKVMTIQEKKKDEIKRYLGKALYSKYQAYDKYWQKNRPK